VLSADPPADVNLADKHGGTALIEACHADAMDMRGRTALMEAVERGHADAVRVLLEKGGADPSRRTRDGRSFPLYLAASHGRTAVLEALIPYLKPDQEQQAQVSRAAACAVINGHAETVKLLVSRWGAALKQRREQDQTLLHLAAAEGHVAVVQALLEMGADRSAEDAQGNTPLMAALVHGHPQVAAILDAGASSPEALRRVDGARLIAATRRGNLRIVMRQLESLAPVPEADRAAALFTVDSDGKTAEDLARSNGHVECAEAVRKMHPRGVYGDVVGTTRSGHCYHYRSCSHARPALEAGEFEQKTVAQARADGYESCQDCARSGRDKPEP
jgi:ankyrin repeat protein